MEHSFLPDKGPGTTTKPVSIARVLFRLWLAAMATIVVAAVVTACADSDPPAESSAVGIVTSGCGLADGRASGVVVERSDIVVTVAHALAGADSVMVRDQAGNTHEATVAWFDGNSDIAVLRVPTLQAQPRELASAGSGDEAVLMVWTAHETIEVKPATISRRIDVTIEDIYIEATVQRSGLEIMAAVERGDSGGAVIVDEHLVGMVYANSRARENVGFALDHTEIRRAVDSVQESASTGRCL